MIIELTHGHRAFIDDEDWPLVRQYRWRAQKYKSGDVHAVANTPRVNGARKMISMHRLLTSAPAGQLVDHENHNTLDNHRYNLRLCTHQQNNFNRRKHRGSSRYKGVSWMSRDNLWQAHICIDGKSVNIGRFKSENEAARAYNAKAIEVFGSFAFINDIKG